RDHYVKLYADSYTEADAELIPTGNILSVEGTPLDLREPVRIGAGIDADFEMLRNAGGYDFNFVIRDYDGSMKKAAEVCSKKSGIKMEVFTDLPGIQFYTGNFLGNTPVGKDGAVYQKQDAFCLETQVFPDAPHHENFPSAVLKAGDTYTTRTIYRFSAE
ncbi:MAG: galactose-1-epimerase, partial [Oscillospiraceae bacterium]|nr:galactose-1-epimerase [Oscillospiraceae bacterium]